MNRDEQWLLSEKYDGEKSEAFFADCERLAAGEPLGYVIGHVPFLNCKIWLDSKPLIPRPETEHWIEKAIEAIKKEPPKYDLGLALSRTSGYLETVRGVAPKAPHVLDLCAGSGAIGVAVAKAVPGARVSFGEIDSVHIPTIGKNLTENHIDCTRYQVFQSDLFENIEGQFDFILTNPPYIDKAANTVEESVEMHEPHLALFGGKDGMELIEKIIAGARASLAPHGQLWIEHESEQSNVIQKIATEHNFAATTHNDQYGVQRYSILVLQ